VPGALLGLQTAVNVDLPVWGSAGEFLLTCRSVMYVAGETHVKLR
jgi:hypothetical protein